MKFQVRFDAFDLSESITLAAMETVPDGGAEGRALVCAQVAGTLSGVSRWVDFSGDDSGASRVTVEFDLDAGTARVVPVHHPKIVSMDEPSDAEFEHACFDTEQEKP